MSSNSLKCVIVGDGYVGKTTLLLGLCGNEYDESYTPTIFENHLLSTEYNGQSYDIILIDTAGQEDYGLLRKQFYESVNVFLVCFDISRTDSFSHVKEVWLPEIEQNQNNTPKILVGTKSDLRNDTHTIDKLNSSGDIFVGRTLAKNFADSHKMKYFESSSVTKENIPELLKAILEVHCSQSPENNRNKAATVCCCVHPLLQFAKRALCCKNNF